MAEPNYANYARSGGQGNFSWAGALRTLARTILPVEVERTDLPSGWNAGMPIEPVSDPAASAEFSRQLGRLYTALEKHPGAGPKSERALPERSKFHPAA